MDMAERVALRSFSSLPYWWSRTRDLDIPQPKTEYVHVGRETLMNVIDGGPLDVGPLLGAVERVGGYPAFLRTDQMACKKSWEETCFVESPDDMLRHACILVDENCSKDLFGEATPEGFAVREFLELDWSFKAFFRRMPVAVEVRAFVRDGGVECVHQYWPEAAITQWLGIKDGVQPDEWARARERTLPPDWRELLASHRDKMERDMQIIRRQAGLVAGVVDGWWSCDFARGRNGLWYLIDMAPGAASTHTPECEHAPEPEEW